MPIRVLIALTIALAARAGAQPSAPPRVLWHAEVKSEMSGLPRVAIDLGYPGLYVPAGNSPIALHAIAADVPFDGYIGFHFGSQGRQSVDVPVVARARLLPHESWTFSTFANLHRWDIAGNVSLREVFVEWRDTSMKLIGSASAGVPPWRTSLDYLPPLRVVGSGEPVDNAAAYGLVAYPAHAGELQNRAQWYAGFQGVIIRLDQWLDLPRTVRDAIFGSGVEVVFVGLPRAGQQLDAMDRALLPVVFESRPGSYERLWPYGSGRIATPMSWSAKRSVGFAGLARSPYIVRSVTATWAADDAALNRALPSMLRVQVHSRVGSFNPAMMPSRPYLRWLTALVVLLTAITSWALMRKDHFVIAVAIVAIAASALAFERNRIREASQASDTVIRLPLAQGVTGVLHVFRNYGPAPLTALASSTTAITGDDWLREEAEIRTSATAPSMGLLQHRGSDWDDAFRWSYRRELAADDGLPTVARVPEIRDFHNGFYFMSREPADNDNRFIVDGRMRREADGKYSCVFALPAGRIKRTQTVMINLSKSLTVAPVEVTWATGSILLNTTQKDVYSTPYCVIPPTVLQAIDLNGGLLQVTATSGRNISPFALISIVVQEKKS